MAQLEYELAYYDSAVHRFDHYTKRTLSLIILKNIRTYKHHRTKQTNLGKSNDKIDIPLRNPSINTKPGWEMRLEWQIKKLKQAKLLKE